jgi:Bacterial type II/III secretion system short domain
VTLLVGARILRPTAVCCANMVCPSLRESHYTFIRGPLVVSAMFVGLLAARPCGDDELPGTPSKPVAIPLKYLDSDKVAQRLVGQLDGDGGAKVWSDRQTNTVYVRASPAELHRARAYVDRVDVVTLLPVLRVVPVYVADPDAVARLARLSLALLAAFGDDRHAWLTADKKSGAIIVSAGSDKAAQVAVLIRALDIGPK